ncbi:MAG TPA: 23S rRNA (pseudouridine(1915)-N(3))-methyltransferase RlmH [Candidatus Saccharimonadales bacterium]
MKLHIITIGAPKLAYAKAGWDEYLPRLGRFHSVRTTQLNDKFADDGTKILEAAGKAFIVALAINGEEFSSPRLANFLEQRAMEGKELCFIIGGPNGLPQTIIEKANMRWSFSPLTFPHDLAMVVLLESLYRASAINAGLPYHK